MNLRALGTALDDIGLEPGVVALGGRDEQCWCIHGTPAGVWQVYWMERGQKNHLVELPDESSACELLLGKLTYSQLIAGVVGKR
ncbi:hypothetical protein [Actinokineospora bangkokensis]|uniref:Uncharacterized protein n=1 Tax=Actinokineospora bangkokensis TaxID=1193682 RepID=A0A1Q9LG19_9PSEU|nr:hypothetical protein [Actinokineospora bangkokensis]OLR90976.1 hypothetical protein BJP25_30985 [Actinokineospora bangkokensis]